MKRDDQLGKGWTNIVFYFTVSQAQYIYTLSLINQIRYSENKWIFFLFTFGALFTALAILLLFFVIVHCYLQHMS